ncbi:MAG: alpha/beta fold hydrolase [Flavobacteriaceae bacterium]
MKLTLTFLVLFVSFSIFSQTEERYPIIFVHGMLGSGDTWVKPVQQFIDQGYPENYLDVLDWNTLSPQRNVSEGKLDSLINHLLTETGKTKVNLVGHSAGGGLVSSFILNDTIASKVNKYVHVGSGNLQKIPAAPTLNLFSQADLIVKGSEIEGITNVKLQGLDHYEIATDSLAFAEMYRFFHGENPKSIQKQKKSQTVTISGKVLVMGENRVPQNATVTIFPFNPKNGQRLQTAPLATRTLSKNGNWLPVEVESKSYLEFVITPENGKAIHYFREPFTTSNPLVYLRTLPTSGMAAMLFSGLPTNEEESVLVIFSANKATITGRDFLSVNGLDLTTPELASTQKTAIAHFVYDDKSDRVSSKNPIPVFGMMPFMSGIDVWLEKNKPIELNYQNRSMTIPSLPSSKSILVAVFE